MSSRQIESGASFDATIRISNVGSTPFVLDTSSRLEVHLFLPGGTKPVGAFELAVAGTGLGRTIGPGASTAIPGYGGTASCDGSRGYALPAGPYQARALVDFTRGLEGGHGPLVFWSDALDVEVVAAPSP